jgi:CRISPR-associated protein Cas5t
MMQAVHVHLEGYTAFFRYTGLISGNQLTLPCPTYANLLGLISACVDKTVCPRDTRIGFEFNRVSEDEDLERTDRLALEKEKLNPHTKGRSILRRRVHFRPSLDLYLTNLDLAGAFDNPVGTPSLGRSQDLCWITKVETVNLTPVKSGMIGATMIGATMIGRFNRVIDTSIPSDIVVATEWFTNDRTGYTRTVQATGYYQVIEPDDARVHVGPIPSFQPARSAGCDLFASMELKIPKLGFVRIFAKSADEHGYKEPLADNTLQDLQTGRRLIVNLPFSHKKKRASTSSP